MVVCDMFMRMEIRFERKNVVNLQKTNVERIHALLW